MLHEGITPRARAGLARVGIDAHRILSEPHSSGAVYLSAFLQGYFSLPPEDRPSLFLYLPWAPDPASWLVESSRMSPVYLRCPPKPCRPSRSYKQQLFWNQVMLPRLARLDHLDIFFCPFHLTPLFLPRVPIVTTVHDLCFLSHPQSVSALGRLVHTWEIWTALQRATRIVVDSDFTLRQLATYFPNSLHKTECIHIGLSEPPDGAKTAIRVPAPSFFWIGRNDPRKNPDLVFEGFRRYAETHSAANEHLWILVPKHEARFFEGMADRHGVHHRTKVFSEVSEAEKWSLLRACSALLLPSVCEGFALPVLEAMQAGCIPIAFAGGPCEEFLPRSLPRLEELSAESVSRMLAWVHDLAEAERQNLSRNLKSAGTAFKSVRMAQRMLSLFQSVVSENRRAGRSSGS